MSLLLLFKQTPGRSTMIRWDTMSTESVCLQKKKKKIRIRSVSWHHVCVLCGLTQKSLYWNTNNNWHEESTILTVLHYNKQWCGFILYYIITVVYLIILSELFNILLFYLKSARVPIFLAKTILQCNYTSYFCEGESFVLFIFFNLLWICFLTGERC